MCQAPQKTVSIMSQAKEPSYSLGDKLLWWLSLGIVLAGVLAYVYLADQMAQVVRVLILLGSFALGALIGVMTSKGRALIQFVREAYVELQKVVWPTKDQTIKTTLLVIAVVVVIGLFLAFVDWVFSTLVGYFFGTGG